MKADIRLKIVSSLAKVFADEEPMEYLETGKYSGFKNEVISFQAAYTSEGMLWGRIGEKSTDKITVKSMRSYDQTI
ncbi:MAG TPA: hypothetical protein DEP23_04320 [Ruminococcaceae bacterium]|nr:hypothetical protein [Oscillospiraceae bacterium]